MPACKTVTHNKVPDLIPLETLTAAKARLIFPAIFWTRSSLNSFSDLLSLRGCLAANWPEIPQTRGIPHPHPPPPRPHFSSGSDRGRGGGGQAISQVLACTGTHLRRGGRGWRRRVVSRNGLHVCNKVPIKISYNWVQKLATRSWVKFNFAL